MKEKLTWWQYQNQDRIWLVLFLVGFIIMIGVIIFDQIDPFYSRLGFRIALAIPLTMMISINYFIFYRGWKKYLNDHEDK